MIDPTLTTAALAALEASINTALKYDPGSRVALDKLSGQILAIECTAPELKVFLLPTEEGLKLLSHYEELPTTQLRGSALNLIKLLASDNTNLSSSGVEVLGSTALLSKLQTILKQVDIDWEEALSQVSGDAVGPQLAAVIRKAVAWSRTRQRSAQRLFSEYLSEELRAVPSKPELEAYYNEVSEVRSHLDRLAARLQLLTEHSTFVHTPCENKPAGDGSE